MLMAAYNERCSKRMAYRPGAPYRLECVCAADMKLNKEKGSTNKEAAAFIRKCGHRIVANLSGVNSSSPKWKFSIVQRHSKHCNASLEVANRVSATNYSIEDLASVVVELIKKDPQVSNATLGGVLDEYTVIPNTKSKLYRVRCMSEEHIFGDVKEMTRCIPALIEESRKLGHGMGYLTLNKSLVEDKFIKLAKHEFTESQKLIPKKQRRAFTESKPKFKHEVQALLTELINQRNKRFPGSAIYDHETAEEASVDDCEVADDYEEGSEDTSNKGIELEFEEADTDTDADTDKSTSTDVDTQTALNIESDDGLELHLATSEPSSSSSSETSFEDAEDNNDEEREGDFLSSHEEFLHIMDDEEITDIMRQIASLDQCRIQKYIQKIVGKEGSFLYGWWFVPATSRYMFKANYKIPIYFMDAGFMHCEGNIFAVASYDANRNIVPLLYVYLVDVESASSWRLVLRILLQYYTNINTVDSVWISDQDKGLFSAINEILENGYHFFDSFHRSKNVQARCGKRDKEVYLQALRCKTKSGLEDTLQRLSRKGKEYVAKIPLNQQFPAASSNTMWRVYSSQGAEVLMHCNKEVRDSPHAFGALLKLLEVEKVRFERRTSSLLKHLRNSEVYTPRHITQVVRKQESKKLNFTVSFISEDKMQAKVSSPSIQGYYNCGFHNDKYFYCGCGVPDIDSYKCTHLDALEFRRGVRQLNFEV